jgi:hypothetical protein
MNGTTDDSSITVLDRLVQAHPDLLITVDVTPDGHGDCVRRCVRIADNEKTMPVFVQPMQEAMTLTEFARRLGLSEVRRQVQHQLWCIGRSGGPTLDQQHH